MRIIFQDAKDGLSSYLDHAKRASENLLNIINNILDFSKIDAGKIELESVVFNFNELCEGIIKLLSLGLKSNDIKMQLTYPIDVPHFVEGDPEKISQILFNLLNNAIKFTREGSILVNIEVLERDIEKVKLKLTVEDTGLGIAEDKLAYIFERFTQADVSTTREFGGTGLGLSICKKLAEKMGGQIGVESTLGKGSTFWLILPLVLKSEGDLDISSTAIPLEKIDTDLSHAHVLLVEDNHVNQMVVVGLLKNVGCTIVCANDGIEALKHIKTGNFDAILMDCMMPNMDGYQATQEIRQLEARSSAKRIPIIALTANAMENDEKKCIDAGMDDYLTKPINKRALLKILAKWCVRD